MSLTVVRTSVVFSKVRIWEKTYKVLGSIVSVVYEVGSSLK
jgi:hypothetical protein